MSITTGRDFGIAACKHLEIDVERVKVRSVELISYPEEPLQLAVHIYVDDTDMEAIASNMIEQASCER